MRRALLVILAATILVVSGWSATAAAASDAPYDRPTAHAAVDGSGGDELGGGTVPEAVAAVPVLSVVPAARVLLDRGDVVVVVVLGVLAALVATDERTAGRLRRAVDGARPATAPVLSRAPRRGPPAGPARPVGI